MPGIFDSQKDKIGKIKFGQTRFPLRSGRVGAYQDYPRYLLINIILILIQLKPHNGTIAEMRIPLKRHIALRHKP